MSSKFRGRHQFFYLRGDRELEEELGPGEDEFIELLPLEPCAHTKRGGFYILLDLPLNDGPLRVVQQELPLLEVLAPELLDNVVIKRLLDV